MELFRLQLISKNNKKTGRYVYSVVILSGGKYYYGESITSHDVLRPKDVKSEQLKITREIPEQYRKANGI